MAPKSWNESQESKLTRKQTTAIFTVAITLVIAFCLLFIALSDPDDSSAETSGSCGANLTWELNTGTGVLTINGDGAMTDYGLLSTRWGGNKDVITTVVFNGDITTIGNRAFQSCSHLTSITIPNTVLTVGNRAFLECTALQTVTIGSSVTTIDECSFDTCTSLTSITIPNSVETIGDKAFMDCASLQTVNMGNSVVTIGNSAFEDCSSLTSITLSNTTASIGNQGFLRCSSLSTITFGNSLQTIGRECFEGCSSLTSVTLPDTITSIDYKAFLNCTLLNDFTAGDDLESIGYRAFEGCIKLTSVDIPNTVTTIGYSAFKGCISLNTIALPSSLTAVPDSLFRGCTSINSITIGNTATSIGEYAFEGCISLSSVSIGNSVETIGNYAFDGCATLGSIELPNSVTSLGSNSFRACALLTTATLGNSLETINDQAFYGCVLLSGIVIPDSATSIGNRAFYQCRMLETVDFGDNVATIGDSAFYDCTKLSSVTLPNAITAIGTSAFYGCSSVTSYTIGASSPNYSSAEGVLFNKTQTQLINYPAGNTRTTYTIPDSVTSVGNYAFLKSDDLETLVIPNTVNSLGTNAFYDCELVNVTIGNGILNLDAFRFNDKLETVVIGNGITAIPDNMFKNCTSLTDVTLGTSIVTIGSNAFYGASSLDSISIPSSVITVGDQAFFDCTSLSSLIIGDHVTTLGTNVFEGCSSLVSVTIPSSVISIDEDAFYRCTSMTSINVDEENEHYSSDNGILYNKTKTAIVKYPNGRTATTFTMPNYVTSVNDHAFYGSTEIEHFYCSCMASLPEDYSIRITWLSSKTVERVHDYSTTYDWSADCRACTVNIRCSLNEEHNITLNLNADTSVTREPTCTQMGETTYSVSGTESGVPYADSRTREDIQMLDHTLTATPAHPPTCTAAGNIAYWHCSVCDKYYSDEGCTNEIEYTQTVIPATGHSAVAVSAHPATCIAPGNTSHWYCAACDGYFSDEECTVEITESDTIIPMLEHVLSHHAAVAATCTSTGNKEYWQCNLCDGYFSDSAGNLPTTSTDIVIPIVPHTPVADADVPATCTTAGHTGGSHCSVCGVVTQPQTPVDPLGHAYSATYEWSSNGRTCTVRIVCANDSAHNHDLVPDISSSVKSEATYSKMGVTTYSVSGTYDGFSYSDSKDVADIPYVPKEDGGTKTYEDNVPANKATDVTNIFSDAKNDNGSVEIVTSSDAGELKISFNSDAVKDIGGKTVSLKTNVTKSSTAVKDAELIIEVSLSGSSFSDGKATVTVPLNTTVPEGKTLKVYFINGDERKDMNANFENGVVIFETDHFSTYAVVIEDVPSGGSGGSSPVIFVIVGIVAVIALAGGAFFFLKKRA